MQLCVKSLDQKIKKKKGFQAVLGFDVETFPSLARSLNHEATTDHKYH